jgi:acyl dehydratase
LFFEEFATGQVIMTGWHVLTAEEIETFARAYDPQPIHLQPDWAAATPYGDVIASGYQTMAVAWRLWVERAMGEHGQAGIALSDARWYRPVYAGTRLSCIVRIEEARLTSQCKGLVTMGFDVKDGEDRLLLTFRTTALIAREADREFSGDQDQLT